MSVQRRPRRELVGRVIRDRMQKTRVVEVQRAVRHQQYEQVVRRSLTLKMHDPANTSRTGDHVRVRECRPLAKGICWVFVEKVTI